MRSEDMTGITIWSIIAMILLFPPAFWVGPIPVYQGVGLMAEMFFMAILLGLWAWVSWTS